MPCLGFFFVFTFSSCPISSFPQQQPEPKPLSLGFLFPQMIQTHVNRWLFVCFHVFSVYPQIDSKRHVAHPLLFPPTGVMHAESRAPEESLVLLCSVKITHSKPFRNSLDWGHVPGVMKCIEEICASH